LFGGKVTSIGFGTGERIFQIKEFYVAKDSILIGNITWEISKRLLLSIIFTILWRGVI
jgi:hypothetical protein